MHCCLQEDNHYVKEFTPLSPTWAALDGDGLVIALSLWIPPEVWTNEARRESNEFGMNFVEIEEHQVGDLAFAQVDYLYIRLEATPAYVIVPIAKVPRTKYSSYQ